MAKNNQVQGPGAEPFQTTDQKRISDPAARGNLGRLLKSSERSTYVQTYAEFTLNFVKYSLLRASQSEMQLI